MLFQTEANSFGLYKENSITPEMVIMGVRNNTSEPHTITSAESGNWTHAVKCQAAATGLELMPGWNVNNGLVLTPDKNILPSTLERAYCLMVWNAYIQTSSNTGSRFCRPFYLNRSSGTHKYENLTIMSSGEASKRVNLSGMCTAPLVWDDDGYVTPALEFNLRENDEITSVSFACIIFTMK